MERENKRSKISKGWDLLHSLLVKELKRIGCTYKPQKITSSTDSNAKSRWVRYFDETFEDQTICLNISPPMHALIFDTHWPGGDFTNVEKILKVDEIDPKDADKFILGQIKYNKILEKILHDIWGKESIISKNIYEFAMELHLGYEGDELEVITLQQG